MHAHNIFNIHADNDEETGDKKEVEQTVNPAQRPKIVRLLYNYTCMYDATMTCATTCMYSSNEYKVLVLFT